MYTYIYIYIYMYIYIYTDIYISFNLCTTRPNDVNLVPVNTPRIRVGVRGLVLEVSKIISIKEHQI
jgi:hypothetical protein